MKWVDRKKVKERFADWKSSDDPFLLLHVPDTQEIRDARIWMKAAAAPLRFAAIQRDVADKLIVKNLFLKELAEELDGAGSFPSFYKEFDKDISEYLSISLRQGIGNHAQAGDGLTVSEAGQHQNLNVVINQMPSLEHLREGNIEKLTDLFLEDFQRAFNLQQVLLSFQFLKAGYQGFSDTCRNWLRRLCRNLARKGQVKLCIVNQGDLGELLDFDTDHVETVSPYLRFDDILKETGDEAFCCGLAEPPDGKIIYSDFKHKYAARLKRKAALAA